MASPNFSPFVCYRPLFKLSEIANIYRPVIISQELLPYSVFLPISKTPRVMPIRRQGWHWLTQIESVASFAPHVQENQDRTRDPFSRLRKDSNA